MSRLDDVMESVIGEVDGALGCAVCDLRSGALLGVAHHVPYFTQEYLEAVAAAAVEMFRGRTVRHVEDLISGRRGRVSERLMEEVQMTTRHTIHFMTVLPNHPEFVVVLITNRQTSLGQGWAATRASVLQIEPILDAQTDAQADDQTDAQADAQADTHTEAQGPGGDATRMRMPPSPARQEAEALARSKPAERFDRVVRLAQAIFGAPIAALNLIGNESQYTVASVGFPTGEMPLDESVCRVTVLEDDVLEVSDLREDERFSSIPAVTGPPRLRFYAGIGVRGQSGQNIGALCILDLTPRTLGRQQKEMLQDLGALLEHELSVQEEMDLAGRVQQLMLPAAGPDIAGVEIAGRVQPAREAGGDYFDWFVVQDPGGGGKLLEVVLGDVMGKGLAASLIASEVRAVLRGHSRYTDVGDAVARTSTTTRNDLEANNRFSTLWVGRLDPATGKLDYVDVGHGLAIIASRSGYRRLYQNYLPLGMPIIDTWTTASDVLAEDELLVIVSDGVFDVLNDSFDEVEARLDRILEPGLSCRQIVDRIVDYAVTHDATDDVTAMVVRRAPGGADG